jgi:hypothetical protein
MLITATPAAFVLMMRRESAPGFATPAKRCILPLVRDCRGLWIILLMSVGYSPLAIYAPLFLQRLHGVSLLGAGYMVTLASLATDSPLEESGFEPLVLGRQRGVCCRANDAPLWAAAAPNYFDFEAFGKTIGCHSSPDPGQPFFNLIICRARLSPSPG